MIATIGLDADDTLWHNENHFAEVEDRLRELLGPYCDDRNIDEELLRVEKGNLAMYGYGVKAFTLSMIELAGELSNHTIPAADIAKIITWGREMLDAPVELLPGVHDTVMDLAQRYHVVIMTKGDLYHQEAKILGSDLAEVVHDFEIMAVKTPDAYRKVLDLRRIDPSSFLMVGNSVPSDVLPVVQLGGHGAHIPYHVTWEHEVHEEATPESHGYHQLDDITEVPDLAAQL